MGAHSSSLDTKWSNVVLQTGSGNKYKLRHVNGGKFYLYLEKKSFALEIDI